MIIKEDQQKNHGFIIRKIKGTDVAPILSAGYNFGKKNLKKSWFREISQYLGLSPQQTGFIVYSVNSKLAVASLSLTKHNTTFQSIRYVFTNPDFRRRGLATKLVNYALSVAEHEDAKKVFLTSDPSGVITELYKRLGFRRISDNSSVWGGGRTQKVSFENKDKLINLDMRSKKNQDLLQKIYNQQMGKNWVSFFGNDLKNFIFGYSLDFIDFFYKSVYITEQMDSFVIIIRRPIRHIATAYLFIANDIKIKTLFGGLMNLFKQNGVSYSKIVVFNVTKTDCHDLLKRHNFYPCTSIFMGKYLDKS
jgi:ribosomal protein S18 acetylase RimI-like enzyme